MQCVLAFLVGMLAVTYVSAAATCKVVDGSRLVKYSNRKVRIRAPCKFNMLEQTCGKYRVTLTPGLMYVLPFHVWDTLWIGVKETADTSKAFYGRTTNKVIAKSIIFGLANSMPLNTMDNTTVAANDLFTYSNTSSDVTITAKNNDFSITLGPWDFNGNKHKDSRIIFKCNKGNVPTAYPRQYCGDDDGMGVKDRADLLWGRNTGEYQDLTLLFDLFNDTTIEQVDDECIAATTAFTSTCSSDAQRREALMQCHQILTDDKRTQCVVKRACSPIRIFRACLQFVCNGYDYDDACEELGEALDLCRSVGYNVTEEMKKPKRNGNPGCYRDLLTYEDSPFYPK